MSDLPRHPYDSARMCCPYDADAPIHDTARAPKAAPDLTERLVTSMAAEAVKMRDRINVLEARAVIAHDEQRTSKARVEALEAALLKVSANCDHTDDCDRAREWATNDTPCTCCMRDVEAALEDAP